VTADELDTRVREAMSKVLKRPVNGSEFIDRDTEPKWDSLKHVELLFSLEDVFSIKFDEKELAELNNIDALVESIEKHREA